MYDLRLSPEQLQIRDTVRDFVVEVIKPLALKPERLEARARPLLVAVGDWIGKQRCWLPLVRRPDRSI